MNTTPQYEAVVFDFFGVLCSLVIEEWFEQQAPGPSGMQMKHEIFDDADLGVKAPQTVYEEAARFANTSPEDVVSQWNREALIDTTMVALLKSIKGNYKTALCSNAFSDFLRPLIRDNNLESCFDTIVISSEHRLMKPDVRIYEYTLAQIGVHPHNALFIDDNMLNVDAARSIGMTAIHFTSRIELEKQLNTLGVIF